MGVDAISLDFRRIHWSPVVNSRGDLGTDLFVQVRDERRFSLGLMVGAQAKAGSTWFEKPVYDADGALIGWWFYEPDKRHFDEWVEHGLPHLVVLHDLERRCSYWVHVTAGNVESTGKGCKVLVPVDQTIDAAHADDLIKVAATMRQGVPLQGTAWVAGALPIGPGSVLRHALIAPRLVAPHPNLEIDDLSPEQALALIIKCRHEELIRYTKRLKSVPSMNAAKVSKDWRWQFVAAMWQFTTAGGSGDLARLASTAASGPQRAASAVAAACAAIDSERYDDAIEFLSGPMERAEPIDCAWLLAQRARVRADLGLVAEARQDAARAQRYLAHASDDLTAAAIRAAAGQLLFQTSAWGERSVGAFVEENDTAVSWWRGRTMAAGLTDAAERQFSRYTADSGVKLAGADVANNKLYAVQLGAHLTGEHSTWRGATSLLAQHTLMFWTPQDGPNRYAGALDDLRRSGDRKSINLAAIRTWRAGPTTALADVTCRVHDIPWTHTTTGTNLLLWKHGGDLLPADLATAAANRCLDILADPAALTSVALPFRIDFVTQQALAGLLPTADANAHRRAIEFLEGLPADAGPGKVDEMMKCLRAFPTTALTSEDVARLRETARRLSEPHLATAVMGVLAGFDPVSQQYLLDQIAAGDVSALRAFGGDDLPTDAAVQAIRLAAHHTDIIVSQTREHTFAQRDWDPPAHLAEWNCRHPDIANWEPLLRLLAEPFAPGQYKRNALVILAANIESVPEAVRAALTEIVRNFSEPPNPYGQLLGKSAGGAVKHLAMALGAPNAAEHADLVSQMLTGTAQDRLDFIQYVVPSDPVRYAFALLTLLGDGDIQIRANAGYCAARAATLHDDRFLHAAVRQAADDPGALTPLGVASGLKHTAPLREDLSNVLSKLEAHASARVRFASKAALEARVSEPDA